MISSSLELFRSELASSVLIIVSWCTASRKQLGHRSLLFVDVRCVVTFDYGAILGCVILYGYLLG